MNLQWRRYLNSGVTIEHISEDGIIAITKAAGILSHPNNNNNNKNCLLTCNYFMEHEAYSIDDASMIYLLNRLDSPVSGLVVLCSNPDVKNIVKDLFKKKAVTKKYFALVKGYLPNAEGIWTSKISKIKKNNFVRANFYGNNIAITKYKLIQKFLWQSITLSLIELQPITGRTHQLRIHCAQNHIPIIGDKIYGDFSFNKKFHNLTKNNQLLLHSHSIEFTYLYKNTSKKFYATSSYDFKKACISTLIS